MPLTGQRRLPSDFTVNYMINSFINDSESIERHAVIMNQQSFKMLRSSKILLQCCNLTLETTTTFQSRILIFILATLTMTSFTLTFGLFLRCVLFEYVQPS